MCGRFTLRTPLGKLIEQFQLESAPEQLPLRFNVAPTDSVLSLRDTADQRETVMLRWGLVPPWAKELSIGSRMINARSETVAEKPAFREAFRRRRCLVLADGYLEWKKVGSKKQPYHIRMQDHRPFAFAGLWERWTRGDEPLETCTILTTDANSLSREVHDRMPVILQPNDYDLWLDPKFQQAEPLQRLLQPYPSDEMEMVMVSMRVNSVRHDDAACLQEQRELF